MRVLGRVHDGGCYLAQVPVDGSVLCGYWAVYMMVVVTWRRSLLMVLCGYWAVYMVVVVTWRRSLVVVLWGYWAAYMVVVVSSGNSSAKNIARRSVSPPAPPPTPT